MLAEGWALILHPRQKDRGLVGRIDATTLRSHDIDRVFLFVLLNVVARLEPLLEFRSGVVLPGLRWRLAQKPYFMIVGPVSQRKHDGKEEDDGKNRILAMDGCQTDVEAKSHDQQRKNRNKQKCAEMLRQPDGRIEHQARDGCDQGNGREEHAPADKKPVVG